MTKYATKAPKGPKRLGDVLPVAVDEVCKYEADEGGGDTLRKPLQKTLGDRDFGIFEAVHLGLRLPLVLSLVECVSLNTTGARVLKSRRLVRDGADDASVTWNSKLDKFDQRKELVQKRAERGRSDISLDAIQDTSLYEYWWKFREVRGQLMRATQVRVRMVTPAFPSDAACVLSDKHSDYAQQAVIAYWRMLPTAERHQQLAERLRLDGVAEVELQDPKRSIEWGRTPFAHKADRFLGVLDLVLAFDTDRQDSKGRPLGWPLAPMEMLTDPMLVSWVPSRVREQYERWNPFFRACLRNAQEEFVLKRGGDGVSDPFSTPRPGARCRTRISSVGRPTGACLGRCGRG